MANRDQNHLESVLPLLNSWAQNAEQYWTDIPQAPGLGCYGTGYNGWGVQTLQKYVAAMATLAHFGSAELDIDTEWAKRRALAGLRFNLSSHLSGDFHCTDNTQWGHTWISALGTERMMFALRLLRPFLTDKDLDTLRRVLCTEADWLLADYRRGRSPGIQAGLWNSDGKNHPESNIWNGAALWRAAVMYPDHPHAAQWRERAHQFLINGVSIGADKDDTTIIAERMVKEWHLGANFFDNFALDHHGYFNVGYMVICHSNAAMLHFDLKASGLERPQSLDFHQRDLWQVTRRFIFDNGRLARLGGDSRVRYAYCQDYLLPALLYAADQLGEKHAQTLIDHQLEFIGQEVDYCKDGSFYGRRLEHLKEQNPSYYTRLESDRACALAMLLAYGQETQLPHKPKSTFEQSVSGAWSEPQHGAVLHRCESRLASFSWRAHDLAQGLCLPPQKGHWTEWEHNLAGSVEFADHRAGKAATTSHRRLEKDFLTEFEGGFVTSGTVMEGVDIMLAEGWRGTDSARHQIAIAALPDGHTMIGLQHCRMADRRGYVSAVKGLQYNLPNDLYNNFSRQIITSQGTQTLTSPAQAEKVLLLNSNWVNVENTLGIVGIYGAESLAISRSTQRRAGALQSLFTEEICYPAQLKLTKYEADQTILDAGWAVLASADAQQTQSFTQHAQKVLLPAEYANTRAVRVTGLDDKNYLFIANFGETPIQISFAELEEVKRQDKIELEAGTAKLVRRDAPD